MPFGCICSITHNHISMIQRQKAYQIFSKHACSYMSYIPQSRSIAIRTKHLAEYLLLLLSFFFINLLPLFLIDFFTSIISRAIWFFCPFRITVAYDNLSIVFPDKSHASKLRIIHDAYHRFVHAAGLIFVIHRKRVAQLINQAEINGLDILDKALSEGKGVILTTYHGCWFEAYFAWFSKGDRPTSLIYKRQKNPLCDRFFVNLRRRYGTSLKHIDKYEKLDTYRQELDHGQIVIISLDQNYTDNGTPVKLFDHEFSCARGTALLHLKTGAPVLTSVYYMRDNALHIDFERVDLPQYHEINNDTIKDISNRSIIGYEKTIQAYPDQWFSLFIVFGKSMDIRKKFQDL